MRAIVAAIEAGRLDAQAAVAISNNANAEALSFARGRGVPVVHISRATAGSEAAADTAILAALTGAGADVVILSGYLRMVGPATLQRYRGCVLNVHPALLPKFGGKGMYGRRVHEAVIAAGETLSGASVHVVDEVYDHGPVISRKTVPVLASDTAETLAARVVAVEGPLFVETLQAIAASGGVIAEP
jgi:phosphoribosylglycinamide formyltransferase-1